MSVLKHLVVGQTVSRAAIDLRTFLKAGDWQIGNAASAVMLIGLIYVAALGVYWISSDALTAMQTTYDAKRDLLSALEIRNGEAGRADFTQRTSAKLRDPFFSAATETLAAAQLDDELRRVALEEDGVVLSSHARIDHDDRTLGSKIEIKGVVEGKIGAVQALLYRLETSVPMIFVEELDVEPKNDAMRGEMEADPTLEANLTLAAYWHSPDSKGPRK